MHKNSLGQKGEDLAAQYLEGILAWTLLERNVHYRCGELDLIAEDEEGSLIFIEVKTRKSSRFGGLSESLTPQKIQRLKRSCLEWMREHQLKKAFRIEFFGLEMKKGAWILERFIIE